MDPKKDYYKILGVSENASQEDIKKAYRRLAKEHHPDAKGGDNKAEERFKDISEAYAVLKDSKRRREYDMMRKNPFASGGGFNYQDFGQQQGGGFRMNFGDAQESFGSFDDLLGNFFGFSGGRKSRSQFDEDLFGRRRPRQQKGADYQTSLTVPFEMAALGGETYVQTPGGKRVKLRIPAGTLDGKKVKMTGQGAPSPGGGIPGDLYITIHISPHPRYESKGNNIYSTEEINIAQAVLGSEIEVKTIHGQKVKLKIPAGTDSGKLFRLKKLGIPGADGKGDHFVKIKIVTPKNMNGKSKKRFEEWARTNDLI